MKITIDKQDAQQLLSINIGNRTMDMEKVGYYRNQMNHGFWYVGGSHVELQGGRLTNGQHRLTAFLQSDKEEITFLFKIDTQPLTQTVIGITQEGAELLAGQMRLAYLSGGEGLTSKA